MWLPLQIIVVFLSFLGEVTVWTAIFSTLQFYVNLFIHIWLTAIIVTKTFEKYFEKEPFLDPYIRKIRMHLECKLTRIEEKDKCQTAE